MAVDFTNVIFLISTESLYFFSSYSIATYTTVVAHQAYYQFSLTGCLSWRLISIEILFVLRNAQKCKQFFLSCCPNKWNTKIFAQIECSDNNNHDVVAAGATVFRIYKWSEKIGSSRTNNPLPERKFTMHRIDHICTRKSGIGKWEIAYSSDLSILYVPFICGINSTMRNIYSFN